MFRAFFTRKGIQFQGYFPKELFEPLIYYLKFPNVFPLLFRQWIFLGDGGYQMSWFGWSDEWTGDPNELGFSWSGVDRYRRIWMTMRRLCPKLNLIGSVIGKPS